MSTEDRIRLVVDSLASQMAVHLEGRRTAWKRLPWKSIFVCQSCLSIQPSQYLSDKELSNRINDYPADFDDLRL